MKPRTFLTHASKLKTANHYEIVTLSNGQLVGVILFDNKTASYKIDLKNKYTVNKKGVYNR